MRTAPLALLLVWAAPAHADVAVPQPAAKLWRDECVLRIDGEAKRLGLPPGARVTVLPLLHEDGKPNSLQYVEYATPTFKVTVGQEPESRPDKRWTRHEVNGDGWIWFRRLGNRFAKIEGDEHADKFRGALDECLKMGDLK